MRALRLLPFLLTTLAAATPPRQPLLTFHLPPGTYERAIEFQRRIHTLHFIAVAWDILGLALLIRLDVAARVRDWAAGRLKSRFLQNSMVVGAVLGALWLWSLPIAIYRHHLGLRFEISIEAWGPWLFDLVKGALAVGIPAALIILAFLAIARRSPRRWWLYGWAVSVVIMIAATFAVPFVFDPLFFQFTPLKDSHPSLVDDIEAVVARAGMSVPPDRIYQMDASSKTRAVNAYMTGFGPSRRIVIWDTTIDRLTPPQIQSVFAHELGHYALAHIPKTIALAAAGMLLGLFLLDRILRWIGARRGGRGLDDVALLPTALLLVTLAGFLTEPVSNTYSRWQERQADIYELETMRGLVPDPGRNSAEVDQIMGEIDLDDPNPGAFVKLWLYDHPPTPERMIFAQEYGK